MGLSLQEALTVPYSLLLDLMAIEQIKNEGAERKLSKDEEMEDFERLLMIK